MSEWDLRQLNLGEAVTEASRNPEALQVGDGGKHICFL